MERFTFVGPARRQVDQHDSTSFSLARLAAAAGDVRVGHIVLGPGGRIGVHTATVAQVFAVVVGRGRLLGGSGRGEVETGDAAFWCAGDEHGVETDEGLTAIVIEGESVRPPER